MNAVFAADMLYIPSGPGYWEYDSTTSFIGQLSEALLSTYDRKRAALGVAVARLVGKQCQGCHLELSAAEIDTVKDEAADTGVTDCPDCGRLLIV